MDGAFSAPPEPALPDTAAAALATALHACELEVVALQGGLLVLDKPAGTLVQPARDRKSKPVALSARVEAALRQVGQRTEVGVVHRLDAGVSGLVALGLDAPTTAALSEQLRARTMRRRYLALVRTWTAPTSQVIDEPIRERPDGRREVHATGQPARSRVEPIAFDADRGIGLVHVELDTGRTHQIRVHLAWAIGAVVGDRGYGDIGDRLARLGLHAADLTLRHGAGGLVLRFQRAPGADFWALAGAAAPGLQDALAAAVPLAG